MPVERLFEEADFLVTAARACSAGLYPIEALFDQVVVRVGLLVGEGVSVAGSGKTPGDQTFYPQTAVVSVADDTAK